MSPEQAKGKPADARSDIWSFGVVLFEMLAGKQAFSGESTLEILGSVLKAEPDWHALPAATPLGIRRAIRRCLQKDRKIRLRDIADARFQIEEALTESPTLPAVQPARRTRERVRWMAAMVVVIAVAVVWIVYSGRTAGPALETRLSVVTPGGDLTQWAISPDGRKLVFATADQIWLRLLDSETAQPLAGASGARPFWSPDSQSIGFFSDGQLKWFDIAGGPARTVAKAPNNRGGSWGSDGTMLFVPANADPIYRVAANGGTATPVTRLDPPRQVGHRFPWFLPDGRHFLFYATGTPESQGIYIGSLDKTDTHRLFDADGAAVFSPPNRVLFARQGALWAQLLDMTTLSPTGAPLPIASQASVSADFFAAVGLSASSTGTVAYRADAGKRQLVWFDRAGHRVGTVGNPDASQPGGVRLSPDGRSVLLRRVVSGNMDAWVMDTERAALRRLTFDPAKEYEAAWSPDGSRVLFSSDRNGALDLYEKPVIGSGPETLLLQSPLQKIVNDWSPDGRYIIYETQSPNLDIWALPLDGDKKPLPVAQTPFREHAGRFSPDGHWVSFCSDESGRNEVYVQAFPGPGSVTQVSSGGCTLALWRRDGKELFYVGLTNRLMAVPITLTGSTVKAGAATELFELPPLGQSNSEFDVSADGQRFLVNVLVEDPSPITIILNWAARKK